MAITAIETHYKGYRFRSRIEARWAVFFDAIGVRWQYEKEGYDLGNGIKYLPDFWLPDFQYWIEIKGDDPSAKDCEKLGLLVLATGCTGFLFYGDIPTLDDLEPGCDSALMYCKLDESEDGLWEDIHYCWCVCPFCKKLGIEFDGRGARVSCKCDKEKLAPSLPQGHNRHPDKMYTYSDPLLLAAYDAARFARFEFGETPR